MASVQSASPTNQNNISGLEKPDRVLRHSNSHQEMKKLYKDTIGSSLYSSSTHQQSGFRMKTEGSSTGFSQFIGSATLRHSSPLYSFSRDLRFKDPKISYNTAHKLNLPHQRRLRGTALGFGQKYYFPEYTIRNAKIYPSPDAYFHQTDQEKKDEQYKRKRKPEFGKTFGESFEKYRSVYVPKSNLVNIQLSKQLPGVGSYDVSSISGKDKLQYSLYGPGIRQNELVDKNPPPNRYHPGRMLTEESRFNKITFGKGMKYDFTKKPQRKNPDPQAYEIPSVFDKFNKKNRDEKKKLNARREKYKRYYRSAKTDYY